MVFRYQGAFVNELKTSLTTLNIDSDVITVKTTTNWSKRNIFIVTYSVTYYREVFRVFNDK